MPEDERRLIFRLQRRQSLLRHLFQIITGLDSRTDEPFCLDWLKFFALSVAVLVNGFSGMPVRLNRLRFLGVSILARAGSGTRGAKIVRAEKSARRRIMSF